MNNPPMPYLFPCFPHVVSFVVALGADVNVKDSMVLNTVIQLQWLGIQLQWLWLHLLKKVLVATSSRTCVL